MRLVLLSAAAAGSLLEDLRAESARVELAVRQALMDAPTDPRLVLVVDQFEELFTLCHDEAERRSFVEALLHVRRAPESPVLVVVAVRADFYGRVAAFPALASTVRDTQALVGPMTVRLWDVPTRRRLGKPLQHQNVVSSVAFSPDGKTLASSDYTGKARLWNSIL